MTALSLSIHLTNLLTYCLTWLFGVRTKSEASLKKSLTHRASIVRLKHNKFKSFAKWLEKKHRKKKDHNRSYRENIDLTLKADENSCFRGTVILIRVRNKRIYQKQRFLSKLPN